MTTSGDEEDEAARAVRSILGQSETQRPSTSIVQFQSPITTVEYQSPISNVEYQSTMSNVDLLHPEEKELFLQAELAAVEEANKENSGKRHVIFLSFSKTYTFTL